MWICRAARTNIPKHNYSLRACIHGSSELLTIPRLSYMLSSSTCRFGELSNPTIHGLKNILNPRTYGSDKLSKPISLGLNYTLSSCIYGSSELLDVKIRGLRCILSPSTYESDKLLDPTSMGLDYTLSSRMCVYIYMSS